MQDSIRCELDDYEIKSYAPIWVRILQNRMLVVGGTIVLILLFLAVFVPVLTHYDPDEMDIINRLQPPSKEHLFGTDQYGRDILTRILYGARISLRVGTISTLIGLGFGLIIGSISGYLRGVVDDVLGRVMDAMLAFPPLLLAVALVAAMGPSIETASISIGVVYIPMFARVMRSSVFNESQKEYVEAVEAIGQSRFKILVKHIGPNCLSSILILSTIAFANAVTIEATLSFLGIGVPPPTPSWGTMLDESRRYLSSSIYLALFPGLTISITVLGLNLLGDGLRDFIDPKTYNY